MPYACTLVGSKWNLHKEDSKESLGSHLSKKDCMQQMKAVYSSELANPKNIVFDGMLYKPFDFEEKLKQDGDTLNVVINSQGGDFFDAIAIHNQLRNSGKKIVCHINPIALSAGAIVALAGDKIIMPENGLIMFHSPKVMPEGMKDAGDLEKITNALRASESILINTLISKTKKSQEECQAIMDNETWLTASDAKKMGICDEVVSIYRDIQIQNYFPEKIVNFVKENNEMPMKEMCDLFGVKDEAGLTQYITELKANQTPKVMDVPVSLLNMIKKARESELESLVTTGKVIPAVTNELKLKFISDDRIKSDASTGNQEFEHIVNALSKNESVISFAAKTGIQGGTKALDNNGVAIDEVGLLARQMASMKAK